MADGVNVEDKRPVARRMVRIRTNAAGNLPGTKEAAWLKRLEGAPWVEIAIPGCISMKVPIELLRDAIEEIEDFDGEN